MFFCMFRLILGEYGVEFAAALPFSACRVLAPDIIERRGVAVSEIKTALLFLVPYYVDDGEGGNISVYARAHDYHHFFDKLYEDAVPKLSAAYGARFWGFADKSAIAEVHAASSARLGLIGDSGLIINEKYGSFVFIGELLTDAPPAAFGIDESAVFEPALCSHCGACRKACPMSEGLGCLSMVTQKKGELAPEERDFIKRHGSAWGCDICSAVCPHTKRAIAAGNETPIEFFRTDRMVHLTSEAVNAMDKATFRERAFAWRGKKTILRNLEIFGE